MCFSLFNLQFVVGSSAMNTAIGQEVSFFSVGVSREEVFALISRCGKLSWQHEDNSENNDSDL